MPAIALAQHLRERHAKLMRDTEDEAALAAQNGDRARQSIASTESERHRQVMLVLGLVLDEAERDGSSHLAISDGAVEAAVLAEREAAAQIADSYAVNSWGEAARRIARDIRRGASARSASPKPGSGV